MGLPLLVSGPRFPPGLRATTKILGGDLYLRLDG
jgi:hypothetical protein